VIGLRVTMTELTPTPATVSARRVSRSNLSEEVESGIRKVRAAVTAARVPTNGAPFVRYLTMDEEPEVEIGLPLEGSHVVPTLRATILPGGVAASTWHDGPYEEMLSVLVELETWVELNAGSGGDPWVWHWTGPDAEHARIQVVWPLRGS
jgi:effector-binding domain-containing protein